MCVLSLIVGVGLRVFFFFNDTATTEIYTLSLHDALPIWWTVEQAPAAEACMAELTRRAEGDRKSTRLNSSHANISYAVFCLKKKKNNYYHFLVFHTHSSYNSYSSF